MKKNACIRALFAILTLPLIQPFVAHGEANLNYMSDLTTARLNPACSQMLETKGQEEGFNEGLCVGIILGVEDNAHYDKKICVPKDMGIKIRLLIVKGYIDTHPNRINEAYASLVFDALAQKWPCSVK